MPFLTGSVILDAPASALNNKGSEPGAKTDNTIAVKQIDTAQGKYVYVSAQAVRYWIRTTLEGNESNWKAAPVRREGKIAYTDSNPIEYWDDDLFGYMRAPSKRSDASKDAQASPIEKDREITRVSPFRVSTFTSVSPVSIVDDFGTMTRQQGNPVPYEHQFYKAHLLGLLSLDLSASGTFFDGERVGYKNLDSHRREAAKTAGCEEVKIRKQTAFRLPFSQRVERISTLIRSLSYLSGGAKQALHYTDLTPAIVFMAVTQYGNNPFYRVIGSEENETRFHVKAFKEVMDVYKDQLLSPVYVGWAQGFLDSEREALESAIDQLELKDKVLIGHPAKQIEALAEEIRKSDNASWFA